MQIFVHSLHSQLTAVICTMLLLPAPPRTTAQDQVTQQTSLPDAPAPKIPNDQLDSLVAPIALYPDPLLAQALAASTYPLEIIQLQQWLAQHKDLKDKALVDAVMKQPWDPSIQSMAALPDVVKRLADDIQWTTDLGNAVLAQQSDVMDAVQRMREKAQQKGNLKSTDQMKVETKVIENKTVVVIEQASPEVIQVPNYDPVVVYGAPAYPYPPIAYPPPGYYAAGAAISFGVGMAIGAAWGGGGGWCCNSGWGGNNNININNNNTFVNNSNRQNVNNRQTAAGNRSGGGNNWSHNPQHRGGTPYSNNATASKFGGTARGDSMANRQANARQNQGQRGGGQQGGTMDRGGRQQAGASNRGDGGARQANRSAGGGDRVGNRSVSPSAGGGSRGGSGALGGASSGRGGSGARASSSRGASSMGGGSRGGGGRRR